MELIPKIKLVLVGGDKVGKTTFLKNLEKASFDNKSSKIKIETNDKTVVLDDRISKLSLSNKGLNEILNKSNTSPTSQNQIDENQSMLLGNNRKVSLTSQSSQVVQVNKDIIYKNKKYRVTILDSESQTSATELDNKYFLDVNGYFLLFSHEDISSFETIQSINNKITRKVGYKYIPRVLVGNKSDLSMEIEKERIKRLSNKWLCPYVETSNKEREEKNIEKCLLKMMKEIVKEANEDHPYDIKNLGKELNFINRQAKVFRIILNYILISSIIISFVLFFLDMIVFIEKIDVLAITVPSLLISLFSFCFLMGFIKKTSFKDSESVMRRMKYLVLNIFLHFLMLILILIDSNGFNIDYLSFGLYFVNLIFNFNAFILSKNIFPLYLSNFIGNYN